MPSESERTHFRESVNDWFFRDQTGLVWRKYRRWHLLSATTIWPVSSPPTPHPFPFSGLARSLAEAGTTKIMTPEAAELSFSMAFLNRLSDSTEATGMFYTDHGSWSCKIGWINIIQPVEPDIFGPWWRKNRLIFRICLWNRPFLSWRSPGLTLMDCLNIPEFRIHCGMWAFFLNFIPCEVPQASGPRSILPSDGTTSPVSFTAFPITQRFIIWHSVWDLGSSSWHRSDIFSAFILSSTSCRAALFSPANRTQATAPPTTFGVHSTTSADTHSQQGHRLPRSCYLSSI